MIKRIFLANLCTALTHLNTIGMHNENLDLVFLLDSSGSVRPSNFNLMKEWVVQVATHFEITEITKVGVVSYDVIKP